MSEMTLCNHCRLEVIRRQAKKDGKSVHVVPSPWHTFEKGVDVLVDRMKIAWFAELSDKCAC